VSHEISLGHCCFLRLPSAAHPRLCWGLGQRYEMRVQLHEALCNPYPLDWVAQRFYLEMTGRSRWVLSRPEFGLKYWVLLQRRLCF
jgi:hypothetical protein